MRSRVYRQMRVVRFIRRQVRFLVLGSRDVSAFTDRLDAEVEQIRVELAAVKHDLEEAVSGIATLDTRVTVLFEHADNVTAHLRQLAELDPQVSALHDHAANVDEHLREITTEIQVANRTVSDSAIRLAELDDSDTRHSEEIDAMRASLRIAVDDLGDRVTQLTARLNEL